MDDVNGFPVLDLLVLPDQLKVGFRGLVEDAFLDVLRVVVHVHFLFVEFEEPLSDPAEDFQEGRVVGEVQKRLVLGRKHGWVVKPP